MYGLFLMLACDRNELRKYGKLSVCAIPIPRLMWLEHKNMHEL